MIFGLTYALPSLFESTRERSLLGLTADSHRPVRFHARVRSDVLSIRFALQALGQLVWHSDDWLSEGDFLAVLDPVVTVHPDRVFFEAFSQDLSSYGAVIIDRDRFAPEGPVVCGTTNVDFTAWLAAALDEMRSSRVTYLRVEPAGLEVATVGAGGRFEQKVDVPDVWVRAFLQLQASMAMPGTRLTVRPVDLLAAIRHLTIAKAKVSPRGIRWVFEPDRDAKLVLEPWETEVPLRGAEHRYTEPHTIRVWGRRRLRLLQPLLPYATSVDVYLKGRAQPHFYAVHLPGVTFVLGLSGWSKNSFGAGGYDLGSIAGVPDELVDRALVALQERVHATTSELATALATDTGLAARALTRLCRRGRVILDVERREWRHRELFATPIDEARLFPPDLRTEAARAIVAAGGVSELAAAARETRKLKKLKTPEGRIEREVIYRDWALSGQIADTTGRYAAEVVVNNEDRVIFGTCACAFFRENLLNQGPCAHMMALLLAGASLRPDTPTSAPAPEAPPPPPPDPDDDDGESDEEEE